MGREVTKDIAIQHKKQAIRKMNNVFEAFINNPDDKYLKKADLLAYWLETFSGYLLHEQKIDTLNTERKTLNIYNKELQKLKKGSIALMEQITTVSKMRIYKPKNENDLLYGIKYSDGAMDKINERMKELFIYSK